MHLLVSVFLVLAWRADAEWTSGGMASTFPHHDDTGESYTTAYVNVTFRDPATGRMVTEKSEIAKFGGALIAPAQGLLVHVSSRRGEHTACSLPLRSNSPDGQLPAEPWIALVKRGGCNFQVKVENAIRSNASGVIVYNDRDKPTLEKMKLTPTENNRNMSAVFTYKWKGEELARLLDNGTQVFTRITIASHCTRPFNTINRGIISQKLAPIISAVCGTTMSMHQCALVTSVLFVSISFVVLMIISLAWLVFYYVQRFRYIHAKDRLSRRLCSAAKKALSKIPTKHIKAEDKEIQGEGECCAICIEPYRTSDILRILPCKHEFHRSCIDPWLLEHRTCPMCKMDILKHYGFVFTGSQESILHMDIEEAVSDSESGHQNRSLSPVPQVVPFARSLTPDLLSHSSRASTPDEYSPALPQQKHFIRSSTGGTSASSSTPFMQTRISKSQLRRSVSLDNCDLPSTSQN